MMQQDEQIKSKPIKVMYFDLETTSLVTWKAAITELAAVLVIDGKIVDSIQLFGKPWEGSNIEGEALEITGITMDDLLNNPKRISEAEIHNRLLDWLSPYVNKYDKNDKVTLAGYNIAGYDVPVLRAMFKRSYDNFFGSYFSGYMLDIYHLVQHQLHVPIVQGELSDLKQGTVATYYGINVDANQLHGALYDVYIAASIHKNANANADIDLLGMLDLLDDLRIPSNNPFKENAYEPNDLPIDKPNYGFSDKPTPKAMQSTPSRFTPKFDDSNDESDLPF